MISKGTVEFAKKKIIKIYRQQPSRRCFWQRKCADMVWIERNKESIYRTGKSLNFLWGVPYQYVFTQGC
jgi:hypothetical protein